MTKFSREHIAVTISKKIATICLTEELLKEIEHISSISLPEENSEVGFGDEFVIINTPDKDLDIISPITGTVIQVNENIFTDLDDVIDNPDKNWLCKITIDDPSEIQDLLDYDEYKEFCEDEERENY